MRSVLFAQPLDQLSREGYRQRPFAALQGHIGGGDLLAVVAQQPVGERIGRLARRLVIDDVVAQTPQILHEHDRRVMATAHSSPIVSGSTL